MKTRRRMKKAKKSMTPKVRKNVRDGWMNMRGKRMRMTTEKRA